MSKTTGDVQLIQRLWPFVRPYKRWLLLSLFLTPVGVGAGLVQPLILKAGIDEYIAVGQLDGLGLLSAAFVAVVAIAFGARALGSFALQRVGLYGLESLRAHVFGHVTRQDQRFFDTRTTGSLMTRTTNDVEAVYESLTFGVVNLITDSIMIIGIISVMAVLDWRLTLVSLSFAPIIIFIVDVFRRRLRNLFLIIRKKLSELNGYFAESVYGISTIQLAGAEPLTRAQFGEISYAYLDAYKRSNWLDAGLYAIMDGLSAIAVGILLLYGGSRFGAEGVTVGLLVAYVDYLIMLFGPVRELSGRFATLQRGAAALQRIFQLLDTSDRITSGTRSAEDLRGHITFEGVSFAYGPNRPQVLHDLNFSVTEGDVVAVVGATGSGKTTISRLLARTYGEYSGRIMVDGHELASYDLQSVRRKMAVVSQEVDLFQATIADNIALWAPSISRADVVKAAKLAQVHDIIERLPGGYDYEVEGRTGDLSVGERQLIAIARALAHPAPIVLLDEATASVDSLTEERVEQAIASLFNDRTVIVIAHRISTVAQADQIVVVHEGRVVDQGTHASLLSRPGRYRVLVESGFSL